MHPLVSATTRTPANAVLTTAPAAPAQQPEPASQPTMSLSLGGGSSIDILVPAAASAPGQAPQQDGSAPVTLAPAQPSYAFSTFSAAGGAAPAPAQHAVEITITSQQVGLLHPAQTSVKAPAMRPSTRALLTLRPTQHCTLD